MLNKRPNPRLVLVGVVCVAALTAQVRPTEGNDGMTVLGRVEPVPATSLILKPARLFDLRRKTVTFTPEGAGGYTVQVGAFEWVETPTRAFAIRESAVEPRGIGDDRYRPSQMRRFGEGESAEIRLPFAFPFAGRMYRRVHANTNGNVSFTAPETTHWEQRDPWSSGTMRSVAAAVDSRSAAGLEAMIAVLWAVYGETAISVDSSSEKVTITWNAVRMTPRNHHYEPLGPNVFQVRLYPSGTVEFAYRTVSERDGIVGLFHGRGARGRLLSAVDDGAGDAPNATVDILSAELVDNGSTVIATATMADDIPDRVSSGTVEYRFFLNVDSSSTCLVWLRVDASGRRPRTSSGCGDGASPTRVGYSVQEATLEIPISKLLIPEGRAVSWSMDAVWWGRDEFDRVDGDQPVVILDESDHNLSSMTETVAGNLFEVFHFPSFPKSGRDVMPYVYERLPASDEFAVVFTDFRVDDLFNTGPASGPINAPIQGIGDSQADPRSGSTYGSDSLLSAVGAKYIGGPRFAESGVDGGREVHGHSYGVRHVAHELVHRWAAHLRFRNPHSGRIEDLTGDGCACPWSEWLHVPVRHPVWSGYANQPYSEGSVMGGGVWQDNGDGTFTEQDTGYPRAMGLSDLDLYAIGMIPPEEVRSTFLLRDVVETDTRGLVRATKVLVRIDDIVAAMGPRVPSASEQRKEFRLGVYLLHEDGRAPHGDLLARAQSLTEEVVKYFRMATGGA